MSFGRRSQTRVQRTKKRQRPRPHVNARENKTTTARSGYGCCTLETLKGETCRNIILQASTWATSCKHDWKYFEGGGLRRTTAFKTKSNKSPLTRAVRDAPPRINLIGLVKKESTTGAYRYRHDGYGEAPGCFARPQPPLVTVATPSIWIQSIEMCISPNYYHFLHFNRLGPGCEEFFFPWKVFIHNWGGIPRFWVFKFTEVFKFKRSQ